jgi:hypothetical protein
MTDTYQGKVRHLQGGDELEVASGGQVTVKTGGKIVLESGGTIDNGGAVAGATITVAAEDTNVRAITIKLTNANGADIASRQAVQVAVLADANGDALVATGGSTGIAIGTDGALLAIVAKKLFLALSEADGDIDLTWTDTGTEAAYLAVILPSGKMVISAALTNT